MKTKKHKKRLFKLSDGELKKYIRIRRTSLDE